MWFNNLVNIEGPADIGRITKDGDVTTYPIDGVTLVYFITTGPDGALWFTGFVVTGPGFSGYGVVGRMTTAGAVTIYPTVAEAFPSDITAGPDGALWFVESDDTIGRITTSGSITDYPVSPHRFGELRDITAGPDGALWFTGSEDYIGRITTGGVVSSYPGVPVPSPGKRVPRTTHHGRSRRGALVHHRAGRELHREDQRHAGVGVTPATSAPGRRGRVARPACRARR